MNLHTALNSTPILFGQLAAGASWVSTVVFLILLLGMMWFVMIRPQMKQQKESQTMLSSLKKGDEVVTSGGVLGRIAAVEDKVITLEVGGGTKLRVLKQSIQGKVGTEAATAEVKEKKEVK